MISEIKQKEYYENPNICKHCGEVIVIKNERCWSEIKQKQFCNKSCANSFNNKGNIKNKTGINGIIYDELKNICPKCGNKKSSKAELCLNCRNELTNTQNKTLGFYIKDKQYLSSKCQQIRYDARREIENSNKEKVCAYCNNHEFDEILEVHHIKGILEFSEETLIKDINNIDNLIWLCPNHHTMLEKGLIKL